MGFKSLWKRMRTIYEASMKQSGVPIEHYRIHQNNQPPHTAASTLLELDVLEFGTLGFRQAVKWTKVYCNAYNFLIFSVPFNDQDE